MNYAGFFEELGYTVKDAGSLHDARGGFCSSHKDEVLRYLENGTVIAVGIGQDHDLFAPGNGVPVQMALLTDGEWLWPLCLAYYVECYDVAVPQAFVAHMEQRGFLPPEVSEDELIRMSPALEQVFSSQ